MEKKKKLSGLEKFAYGIGAVGKDMVYMLSASYILYYYQDIMGVSAWVMGIILMVARVFDAFNDPIMGVLVAKTKSRFGKFRPWLFMGTLTNAIVLFVMFSCPPTLDGGGLVAYAAIFYILWGVTYTMMDIPYWSMVPAFTDSGKERENLSAMARTCAGVGSAIITIVTVVAVSFLGTTFTGKSKNMVTDTITQNMPVYIVEQNEAGEPVKVTEFDRNVTVSVSANKTEFEKNYSFTEENCNYSLVIDGVKYEATEDENNGIKKAELIYVKDNEEGTEQGAALTIFSDSKNCESLVKAEEISAIITSTKEVERVGFKAFSLIIAVLFLAFTIVTCLCIKEKSTVDVKAVRVKEMFQSLLQNDQAMATVITIVLVNIATYITSNLLIYFFKYDIAGANWQGNYTLFNTFGGAMQILAMMAFFPLLRKKFSTIQVFFVAAFSAVFGYVVLLVMALMGANTVYPFLVPCFFIMAAVGIINVLATVFLANTVDYGELKNHRRDESVIFSMQTFVVKLASGVAALVASVSLSIFNISSSENSFDAIDHSLVKGLSELMTTMSQNGAATVSNGAVVGLRLVMTMIPILVLVIALLVFRKKYILTDDKLAEISQQLEERRATEAGDAQ